VVGRPDAVLGEEVVAWVALASGATFGAGERIAFTLERMGRHKHPREVRHRAGRAADLGRQDRPQGAAPAQRPAPRLM